MDRTILNAKVQRILVEIFVLQYRLHLAGLHHIRTLTETSLLYVHTVRFVLFVVHTNRCTNIYIY